MNFSCWCRCPATWRFKCFANKQQKSSFDRRVKSAEDEEFAVLMAEVYVVGQICSAENFREPNLFLRWNFQAGL
jgi:hypothetical protein